MVAQFKPDPNKPVVRKREANQRVGTVQRPWDPTSLPANPDARPVGENEDVRAFLTKHSLSAAKRLVALVENERTSARDAIAASKIILDFSGLKPDASQAGLGEAAGALARVADALRPDEQRIRRQAAVDDQMADLVS